MQDEKPKYDDRQARQMLGEKCEEIRCPTRYNLFNPSADELLDALLRIGSVAGFRFANAPDDEEREGRFVRMFPPRDEGSPVDIGSHRDREFLFHRIDKRIGRTIPGEPEKLVLKYNYADRRFEHPDWSGFSGQAEQGESFKTALSALVGKALKLAFSGDGS